MTVYDEFINTQRVWHEVQLVDTNWRAYLAAKNQYILAIEKALGTLAEVHQKLQGLYGELHSLEALYEKQSGADRAAGEAPWDRQEREALAERIVASIRQRRKHNSFFALSDALTSFAQELAIVHVSSRFFLDVLTTIRALEKELQANGNAILTKAGMMREHTKTAEEYRAQSGPLFRLTGLLMSRQHTAYLVEIRELFMQRQVILKKFVETVFSDGSLMQVVLNRVDRQLKERRNQLIVLGEQLVLFGQRHNPAPVLAAEAQLTAAAGPD